jgi:hypothetical protein
MIEKTMTASERVRVGGNLRVGEFLPLVPLSRWQYRRLVKAGIIKPLTVGGIQWVPPSEARKLLPELAA